MRIMHEYNGWCIYDKFVAHGCPWKKAADHALYYDVIGRDEKGDNIVRILCGYCKCPMSEETRNHIKTVLKFTKIYG